MSYLIFARRMHGLMSNGHGPPLPTIITDKKQDRDQLEKN